MKIIIVGCGKVGTTIAKELIKEGHDLVLIDKNATVVSKVSTELDVLGIIGSSVEYDTLVDAGVKTADVLLAVTESDEHNLLCCLFAKKANPSLKTIARVRDPNYQESVGHIREELGLELTINPEKAAAKEIASLLRFPSAISVETFASGRVELLNFVVPQNSFMVGKNLTEILKSLPVSALFAGILRREETIIPNGRTVIEAEDKVSVILSPDVANKFFELIGIKNNQVKSCLIVGGGKIAYYLATLLIQSKIDVTIIEQDIERCEKLSELLPKATIIYGDGSSQELLDEQGIQGAEAFISLTGMDEQNAMLSLYASSVSNAKVITKINHIHYDGLIEKMNLGSVIHPRSITADRIIQLVRALENASANNVETLYQILDSKAEALSFRIGEKTRIVDVPLKNLKLKDNTLIGTIIRGNKVITPNGNDSIQVGDLVLVVTTHLGLSDISEIIK